MPRSILRLRMMQGEATVDVDDDGKVSHEKFMHVFRVVDDALAKPGRRCARARKSQKRADAALAPPAGPRTRRSG